MNDGFKGFSDKSGNGDFVIDDGSISLAKLASGTANYLIGRNTSGVAIDVQPSTGLDLTAGVLTVVAASTAVAGISKLNQYLIVQEEQASGTNAGTFTSGAWQTRVLNTSVLNEISGASLATNQVTLPAGSYDVSIFAPCSFVGDAKAALYNVTDATYDIIGHNSGMMIASGTSDAANAYSIVKGFITIASEKDFEVRHRCKTTRVTTGFGEANTFGVEEVYAQAIFIKRG